MATQLQLRRDIAGDIASATPVVGEPQVDTTNDRLLIGDGSRQGGIPHANFRDIHSQQFIAAGALGAGSPEDVNALTLDLDDGTLSYNPTAYATYQRFVFKMTAAGNNTAAVTMAVGGLAAVDIKKVSAGAKVALEADDLVAGLIYEITYDGTDFILGSASGGGGDCVLIETASGSAVANVDFTSLDSTYEHYEIKLHSMHPASAVAGWIRLRQSSTWQTSGYSYVSYNPDSGGGTGLYTSTAGASIVIAGVALDTAADAAISGSVWIDNPADGVYEPRVRWHLKSHWASGIVLSVGAGSLNAAGAIDGVRFMMASGNLDDFEAALYGYKTA